MSTQKWLPIWTGYFEVRWRKKRSGGEQKVAECQRKAKNRLLGAPCSMEHGNNKNIYLMAFRWMRARAEVRWKVRKKSFWDTFSLLSHLSHKLDAHRKSLCRLKFSMAAELRWETEARCTCHRHIRVPQQMPFPTYLKFSRFFFFIWTKVVHGQGIESFANFHMYDSLSCTVRH